jgi:hypothetical protein
MIVPKPKAELPMRFCFAWSIWLIIPMVVCAQTRLVGTGPNGTVRTFATDTAVLEAQEVRKDLPCTVVPIKPVLGFDLRLHVGFEVSIPLKSLAGPENMLTVLFRVTSENKGMPVYFAQRIRVPEIEENAQGDAYFQGGFDVGEGRYHVDWLMRDRTERVCASYWDISATLAFNEKDIRLALRPGSVEAAETEPFDEEPPVQRAGGGSLLHVKVLVNFAPENARSAVLQPMDINTLIAILRGIVRDPHIGKFSLVAFNLQQQRVLYRQENADRIDFPALGGVVRSLNLGTVDLQRLSQKHGETDFLAELIRREAVPGNSVDALVFAGPKVMFDENISPQAIKELGDLDYPVFYLNYNLHPSANPWRDGVGYAVKLLKGAEFTISRPRDLWTAVREMVLRTLNFRNEKQTAHVSGQ